MTKGKGSTDNSTTHGMTATILTAVAGIIIAFFTAYFGYRAGVDAIQIPLRATQTAEAKLTPIVTGHTAKATPAADKGLLIESLPVKVYNYEGIDNPKVGKGSSHLSITFDGGSRVGYLFNYSLPEQGEGWTGLAFTFSSAQDLAEYKFVEATIDFGDEQTNTRLFINDEAGQKDSVLLGIGTPLGTGMVVSANGKELTFRIPLDANYKYVNRKIIEEIDFDCDASTTRGNHTFTVKGIRFLKS